MVACSNRNKEVGCSGCKSSWTPTVDKDGNLDNITEICDFCEDELCDKCFRAHECYGHEAEFVVCMGCEAEVPISGRKNHELKPALIDGDPYCTRCAYVHRWELRRAS